MTAKEYEKILSGVEPDEEVNDQAGLDVRFMLTMFRKCPEGFIRDRRKACRMNIQYNLEPE